MSRVLVPCDTLLSDTKKFPTKTYSALSCHLYKTTQLIYNLSYKQEPVTGSVALCLSDIIRLAGHKIDRCALNKLYYCYTDERCTTQRVIDCIEYIRSHPDIGYVLTHVYQIHSSFDAKCAIEELHNKPLVVVMPVKSLDREKFWIGDDIRGYHTCLLTGYNKNGFIIKMPYLKRNYKTVEQELNFDEFYFAKECWLLY